jgi:hypothetical protein
MTWFPLFLITVTSVVPIIWYFLYFVDYSWFQEQMLSQADAAQREQQDAMAMSRETMGIIGALGTVLALLASYAASGIYFMVVGKIRNSEFGFRKGFALAVWASVPFLLLLPLGVLQISLAPDNRITFEALNPSSLNQMLFRFEEGHPVAGLLESISLPFIWNLALLVIGYQAWAGAKRGAALQLVLLPYALVYGIWCAYALSQAA